MFNSSLFNGFQFDGTSHWLFSTTPAAVSMPVFRSYRMVLSSPQMIPFLLVSSTDHRTPVPGLNPSVLFSSGGNDFLPALGLVQEIGEGWYGITPTSQDILGVAPLLMFVPSVHPGVDPCTARIEIVPLSGVMPLRVNMTRYPLTFFMRLSSDHVTPALGLTPTVQICKPIQSFTDPSGLIAEIGFGWYQCGPDKLDVDTIGPLWLQATAPGADPTLDSYDVLGSLPTSQLDRYTLTLLMIRTMLINSGLFTEGTCVISLESQPFPNPSIPSLWINPGSTGFDPELEAGGSRYTLLTSPTFTLNVIVRRMQDIEAHDKNWITNPYRGAYPIIWKIVNLLAGKFVYSVAGDLLTTRSLHPLDIGNPYKYNNDSMMSVVPIRFSTNVQMDIDNSYPYIPQN